MAIVILRITSLDNSPEFPKLVCLVWDAILSMLSCRDLADSFGPESQNLEVQELIRPYQDAIDSLEENHGKFAEAMLAISRHIHDARSAAGIVEPSP
ncbi:hypothetical protein AC1031_010009 [Aphanomyces cochlioides]|nr:hypothetical protein AC1031_010009 [Aphanomyces cochlioides]